MAKLLVEGDIFPELKLPTPGGAPFDMARLRGEHSIAVLFSGEEPNPAVDGFLDRLRPLMPEFEIEGGRVILITPPDNPLVDEAVGLPVLALFDPGGAAARRVGAVDEDGRPVPVAFLADRWFEIFDVQTVDELSPDALLDWLRYVEIQCPE